VASFSGYRNQLCSQDSKAITSAIHCVGLNWFVIQSTFFSSCISVLADTGYQHIFVYCCLKSLNIFLELVFLSQPLSLALCYVGKKCLGLLVLSFLPVLVKLNRMKQIYIYAII